MKSSISRNNYSEKAIKRGLEISFLVLILIFAFILRWQMHDVPFDRDEGEYATIAWMIDEGYQPYRDAFDQKPPIIFWLYKIAFDTFGYSLSGLRTFSIIYISLTTWIFYIFAKKLINIKGALMATFVVALMTSEAENILGHSFNTEFAMLLPLIIAAFYYIKAKYSQNSNISIFLCGLFSGIAFMIKPPALFNAICLFY